MHPNYTATAQYVHPIKNISYWIIHNKIIWSRDIVEQAMKMLDPEGAASRKIRWLKRRRYFNGGPKFLVHVDQNDKLRKFGLCLHAMIDG